MSVVVLVEGRSDAAVVRALAAARGLDPGGAVRIVPMGGVTNIRRHLRPLRDGTPIHVLGLYDAPEERFVIRALRALGDVVDTRQDAERLGFFGCDRDLEDELLRALGPAAALAALAEIGDLGRFRTFQRQPEWRDRDLQGQLRRFAGSGSGRKLVLAERLAVRLTPDSTPRPLARLLERMAGARGPAS